MWPCQNPRRGSSGGKADLGEAPPRNPWHAGLGNGLARLIGRGPETLLLVRVVAGNSALCDVMLLASGSDKVRASRLRFNSHEDQQRINGMLLFCIRLIVLPTDSGITCHPSSFDSHDYTGRVRSRQTGGCFSFFETRPLARSNLLQKSSESSSSLPVQ